jgi:hypothetical protein
MVREASRRLGAHQHPEITLSILPMGPSLELYRRKDLPAVAAYLARVESGSQLWRPCRGCSASAASRPA